MDGTDADIVCSDAFVVVDEGESRNRRELIVGDSRIRSASLEREILDAQHGIFGVRTARSDVERVRAGRHFEIRRTVGELEILDGWFGATIDEHIDGRSIG